MAWKITDTPDTSREHPGSYFYIRHGKSRSDGSLPRNAAFWGELQKLLNSTYVTWGSLVTAVGDCAVRAGYNLRAKNPEELARYLIKCNTIVVV